MGRVPAMEGRRTWRPGRRKERSGPPRPSRRSFRRRHRARASLDRRTVAPGPGETVATSLPSRRDAEGFEQLRDLSDTHLARTGARPQVFLANLGPIAAFTSRATFAKAFFEAGGIEAPANDGFASLDALAAAFRASGARIACLCSSDEVYATAAAPAAEALAAAGAVRIYLAGRPTPGQEQLGGIQVTFINADCNALDLLAAAQRAAAGQNPPGDES